MKLRVQSINFSTGNMIKYQTVKRKYQYATHIHQFTELIIPLKGTLSITINDTTESLTVGQAAFVLPFQPHSYNSNEYNELAIFVFSSAFIPEIYDTSKGIFQKSAVFTPRKIAFSVFESLIIGKDDFELMDIKSALYLMLNSFVKTVEFTKVPKHYDISAEIVKYISEHIEEKISVKDIAEAIGYTTNHISSVVSRIFGDTLSSVITAIRIEKAMNLLCTTDKSCYNICCECGFGSERNFFRKFKELTGRTPTDYRTSVKMAKQRRDGVVKIF